MTRSKFLILIATILTASLILVACRGSENDAPRAEIVRVVETVEVEVTRLVEVVVDGNGGQAVAAVNSADSAQNDVMQDGSNDAPNPTATPIPTLVPTPFATGQPGDFTEEDLQKVWEVWELVERDYYGDLPQDDAITDAMIEAMVGTLGDRFTNYFPTDVAERIRDSFAGDFTGIGAYVDTNDEGFFFIVRPIKGTPAEQAGLEPNDVVIEVDGMPIQGMVTDEVVAIVRGPAGEPVVLTVLREGATDPFDVTIVRDRIIVPQVEHKVVGDGTIGYVRLESFNQLATDQLTASIAEMQAEGIEGLIFDLRYNGGGLLSQAVSVGDLFLPAGDFLIVKDSAGNVELFPTEQDGNLAEEIPLVLLVNDSSASASEIIAGAFRDHERATIIGENTFGKGSVQTPYRLEDDSEFRVTIARFYSPNDIEINGVGVAPDIEFVFTPDIIGDENDVAIDRAVEFLKTGQ